jgi:hypothetical protein
VKRLCALYRSPSYSPLQHMANDAAVMDATVTRLAGRGWQVERTLERDVEAGHVPAADLFVNMCQGPVASERLVPIEADGALIVNRPSSVLACHRHRLARRMAGGHLAFPRTLIVHTHGPASHERELAESFGARAQVWIKRGDVHAERPEDVVTVPPDGIAAALGAFAARGISWAAVQEHVPGPVVKFYGVADGRFFRYYGAEAGSAAAPPPVDEAKLRALAFAAARMLELDVFGGDVAVPAPDRPVLIDINDWPSFAPFRDAAAEAIAGYIDERAGSR